MGIKPFFCLFFKAHTEWPEEVLLFFKPVSKNHPFLDASQKGKAGLEKGCLRKPAKNHLKTPPHYRKDFRGKQKKIRRGRKGKKPPKNAAHTNPISQKTVNISNYQ
jgi:hypothetical protein